MIKTRLGEEISVESPNSLQEILLSAWLPVKHSFGIDKDLDATNTIIVQCIFDHWRLVDGDPCDPSSEAGIIVTQIRARKGLNPEVPSLSIYLDQL